MGRTAGHAVASGALGQRLRSISISRRTSARRAGDNAMNQRRKIAAVKEMMTRTSRPASARGQLLDSTQIALSEERVRSGISVYFRA